MQMVDFQERSKICRGGHTEKTGYGLNMEYQMEKGPT